MSRSNNSPGPHRSIQRGPIEPEKMYPIGQATGLVGWGPRTTKKAKKLGLRVLTFGKFSYVLGSDIIEFLIQQPTIERKGGPGRPDLIAGRLTSEETQS